LPTKELKAHEILSLRDENFIKYHNHQPFLDRIKDRFGIEAVNNIIELTGIRLKREIIENAQK
jgi:hypothetical protein